jgi:hypothetical protein
MARIPIVMALVLAVISAGSSLAEEAGPPDEVSLRAAIQKAIPPLEKASAGSADKRKCFTCHNQAIPILALTEAQQRGFEVDAKNLDRQRKHTLDHLKRGKKQYEEGKGQGGRVLTAGYALWALEAGKHKPDETTALVTQYLLGYQLEQHYWHHPGNRPPSSGSRFATTYVALVGLDEYETEKQREAGDARRAAILKWLLSARGQKALETEDMVFRLRSLELVGAESQDIDAAVESLLATQRDDGGWAQTKNMKSDAYAAATALTALLRGSHVDCGSKTAQQAARFLLDAQKDDGSWHVVTRAKGFQAYFESGYPHGKDQFISCAAGGWATIALTLMLPD